jgi:hypothetical protein
MFIGPLFWFTMPRFVPDEEELSELVVVVDCCVPVDPLAGPSVFSKHSRSSVLLHEAMSAGNDLSSAVFVYSLSAGLASADTAGASVIALCKFVVRVLSVFRCRAWRPAVSSAIVKRDFIWFLISNSQSA